MVGDVLFWENQVHEDGYNCADEEGRAQNAKARISERSLQKCYLNSHRNRIHEANESGVRALVSGMTVEGDAQVGLEGGLT